MRYTPIYSKSIFCFQIDKLTDVARLAMQLVFFCYVYKYNADIQEDLLLCKTLTTFTTEEILKILDLFINENEILWKKCMDVCTDRVKSMMGSIKGVISLSKKRKFKCSNSHCAIYCYQLVPKKMPSDFSNVLVDVIKIVNFIKSRLLRPRIFSIICKDMGSLHCDLLLHTSVCWLGQGKVLVRVFE